MAPASQAGPAAPPVPCHPPGGWESHTVWAHQLPFFLGVDLAAPTSMETSRDEVRLPHPISGSARGEHSPCEYRLDGVEPGEEPRNSECPALSDGSGTTGAPPHSAPRAWLLQRRVRSSAGRNSNVEQGP